MCADNVVDESSGGVRCIVFHILDLSADEFEAVDKGGFVEEIFGACHDVFVDGSVDGFWVGVLEDLRGDGEVVFDINLVKEVLVGVCIGFPDVTEVGDGEEAGGEFLGHRDGGGLDDVLSIV